MLEIDASYGEGGGQLLRTAVALAAITGTPVQLHHIRAGRARPGLAPQHLAAVRAVAQVCGAQLEPLELGAQELCFVPAALRAGTYEFDIGTAGSITLLLQALLPVLLRAPGPSEVVLRGGTDVRAAPPLDYFAHVLLRLLRPIGVQVQLQELRRGYFPRGGGLVRLHVTPEPLRALRLDSAGALTAVYGAAHVANLPAHIAERMRGAAQQHLVARGIPLHIETRVLGSTQAAGMGGALVLWAQTAHSTLGAARVAERGLRAEDIGTSVATELLADLDSGATVDVHAADQLLIYTALAEGESHYRTRELSRHAQTAIWLIEHFLPQRFRTEVRGRTVAITVGPA